MHRLAILLVLAAAPACGDKKSDPAPGAQPPTTTATTPSVPSAQPSPGGGATMGTGTAAATGTGAGTAAGTATTTGKRAIARLESRSGSSVTGTILFTAVDEGVEITATVKGLTPGDHAFHVHEKGDCSAPDATSAGGHFNPHAQPHGAPDADARHAGDFGNLTASAGGEASKTLIMKGVTLDDGASSLMGKGFIVHEKADDFSTQPTGNAGGRVACAVIVAADAATP